MQAALAPHTLRDYWENTHQLTVQACTLASLYVAR